MNESKQLAILISDLKEIIQHAETILLKVEQRIEATEKSKKKKLLKR